MTSPTEQGESWELSFLSGLFHPFLLFFRSRKEFDLKVFISYASSVPKCTSWSRPEFIIYLFLWLFPKNLIVSARDRPAASDAVSWCQLSLPKYFVSDVSWHLKRGVSTVAVVVGNRLCVCVALSLYPTAVCGVIYFFSCIWTPLGQGLMPLGWNGVPPWAGSGEAGQGH